MDKDKLDWVNGNPFEIEIPMQIVTLNEGEKETEDYEPSEGAEISVELQGVLESYTYTPTITNGKIRIHDGGTLPVGTYAVVVYVTESNGVKRRSKLTNVVEIHDMNMGNLLQGEDVPEWASGSLIDGTVYFIDDNN